MDARPTTIAPFTRRLIAYLRAHGRFRAYFWLLLISAFAALVFLWRHSVAYVEGDPPNDFDRELLFMTSFVLTGALLWPTWVGVQALIPSEVARDIPTRQQLSEAASLVSGLERKPEGARAMAADPRGLILEQLSRIDAFYAQSLRQADQSFRMAIVLSSAGTVTLISGVWLFLAGIGSHVTLAAVSTIAGIGLQTAGATAFALHRTQARTTRAFFHKLARLQDVVLAIDLARSQATGSSETDYMRVIIQSLISDDVAR